MGADLKLSAARTLPAPALAYGPLSTLFYDAAYPRADEPEIAWYRARLPRDAGPVLEAMSGSGRLLVPLTEDGYSVHGVDQSEAMLSSCAARLAAVGREARLFRQDLAMLNLPSRYGAVFVAAGSFQLLTSRAEATDALIGLRAHLIGPARLLLDLFVPDAAQHPPGAPVIEVTTVTLPDASQLVHRAESTTDAQRRRTRCVSRYERRVAGRIVEREDETVAYTWYAEDEIVALLQSAGFRDARIEPPAWPRERGRHFAVSARV